MELRVAPAAPPLRRALARAPALSRAADAAILPFLAGVLWYGAAGQGAFYRSQATLFAAALAALALASTRSVAGIGPAVWGFGVLGAGLGAAAVAAGSGPNAAVAVSALGAGLAIVPVVRWVIARGERARLLDTMVWIGGGISVVGIIGVALHRAPWAVRAQGLWRAASTLTYANAMGCLCLLALGACVLALTERPTAARRLATFLTITGFAATLSRGAAVSSIVALIVLAALGRVALLRVLARPALGASLALAGLLPSIVGAPRPLPALLGVLAGAAVSLRSGARRLPAAVLALAVVAALSVSLVGAGRVLEQRALPASETRLSTWRNTVDVAMRNPVFGTGPGTFWILEESRAGDVGVTRYAHNEYLQVFFETGAIGLASVLAAMGIFAGWAWRRRRDDAGHWAIACAMCAAFAAHGALDFVWRLPLLVALAFTWLAVAVTAPPDNGGNDETVE